MSDEYHVRFPVDLGRGVTEEFVYYPGRKLLQVDWKDGTNGRGDVLNITAESSGEVEVELWNIASAHRAYYDADFAGNTPPPEEAPPGVLDGKVYVPPGIQQSVESEQAAQQQGPMPTATLLSSNDQGYHLVPVELDTYNNMIAKSKVTELILKTVLAVCESELDKDSTGLSIIKAQMSAYEEMDSSV
ncbi:hypothetical protein J5I95_22620 [Candidatus Poribacteria bacterium]|nr:hypothetical protein [Candidatus Poribacteria bacterium]